METSPTPPPAMHYWVRLSIRRMKNLKLNVQALGAANFGTALVSSKNEDAIQLLRQKPRHAPAMHIGFQRNSIICPCRSHAALFLPANRLGRFQHPAVAVRSCRGSCWELPVPVSVPGARDLTCVRATRHRSASPGSAPVAGCCRGS